MLGSQNYSHRHSITLSSYNSNVKYLEVTLEDVIISKMSVTESTDVKKVYESVVLNYGKVRYMYTPVDENGVAQGGIPVEHNLATGVIA
jgi:type VI protein secretion system component Hcp